MLAILSLIIILIFEYIGDFKYQSREIALAKSTNPYALLKHVMIVIGFVFIGASIGFGIFWQSPVALISGAAYAVAYGVVHGIQDWFIWKGYQLLVHLRIVKKTEKELKKENNGMLPSYTGALIQQRLENFVKDKEYAEDKLFYDFIGLDRTLHVITLILLWVWILI